MNKFGLKRMWVNKVELLKKLYFKWCDIRECITPIVYGFLVYLFLDSFYANVFTFLELLFVLVSIAITLFFAYEYFTKYIDKMIEYILLGILFLIVYLLFISLIVILYPILIADYLLRFLPLKKIFKRDKYKNKQHLIEEFYTMKPM
jgi:hypothetical protein